ncbi:MAG: YfhO family protein [Hyphomicrobiaceae bacterium]|nr:MAG: YfhO family protein [Hyphomicrobiaceae bacterium]
MRQAREYRVAVGVFLAVWLLLSSPWLTGAVTIPYDAKALFQAQLQFLANALHSGQSPFWNPSSFVGVPQIADPQSLIFSPAFLLAYFTKHPSFALLDAYVLSLLALGGLAVLKFCQDKGWHPAGAAVAAITFAFGASAAWRVQHIAQIQSLAFFAIALWLLTRALDRSSSVYGVLSGAAVGIMVVAPDQVAFLGCYVLAGYVIGHWIMSPGLARSIRNSILPLVCGGVAATAIAAFPLLVTYLFLESSNRPAVAFTEAARGSLHPASLLTAVIADLYGAADPAIEYWGPYSVAWDKNELTLSQNMSQVYLGTLPILLILTAGLTRGLLWAREVRVLVVAAAVLLIYAVGAHTPVFFILFEYLPGVAFFRRPVDATFLVGALASIFAGYLVHRWASASMPFASYRRQWVELALIASIFVAALAVAYSAGKTGLAWKPVMAAIGWIAASGLLLATPVVWLRRGGSAIVVVPAALLAVDLRLNNGPNDSTALPAAQFEVLKPDCRNETIRFLKEKLRKEPGSPWRDRVEVVGLGFEWQNVGLIHGFEDTLGYNPFRLGDVSEATGARDYIAGSDQKVFSRLFPSYRSIMANLLGVRFIATGVPIEQIDTTLKADDLKLIARTSEAYIYENPDVLPRALFVANWMQTDFSVLVASGAWPTFDPARTVLLEEVPEFDAALMSVASQPSSLSRVRIARYENTRIEIEVEAAEAGFVVLHDVWHPWWVADVDGRDAPIYRANGLFRAVQAPAGRHKVTFEFRPVSGAIAELSGMVLDDTK